MSHENEGRISRRRLLGSAAAIGAAGLVLDGCGGGGSTSHAATGAAPVPGTTTSGAAAAKRRGGTFRFGSSDSSSGDSLDTIEGTNTFTNAALNNALYDTLTRRDIHQQGTYLSLAESFEPAPDLTYYDVRLRDAEFWDGSPVTADDVIFTIKRFLNPKTPAGVAPLLATIDSNRLTKLDAKTVRIHLTSPDVTILDGFAHPSSGIVPVGYDPKTPMGSGPFKLKSFDPGVQTILVRNDNYWNTGLPYLDELVFIGFADPATPRVNALTTGQIDGADHVAYDLVRTVQGTSGVAVIVSPSFGFTTWEMRMDVAPFSDVRVRQAIKLLANREQMIEQAYAGSEFATVANDLPSRQDPLYNTSIPQRTQDVEQARSLLKQAGQSDLRVQLAVSEPFASGSVAAAQVLAEQAKAAGVTIQVNSIPDDATYFAKYWVQAPFKIDNFFTQTLFEAAAQDLLPNAVYNISKYNDPTFTRLVIQARGTGELAKRKDLLWEAQQTLWENSTQAIYAFNRIADAYSTHFTGFQSDVWAYGLNMLYFEDVSLS